MKTIINVSSYLGISSLLLKKYVSNLGILAKLKPKTYQWDEWMVGGLTTKTYS